MCPSEVSRSIKDRTKMVLRSFLLFTFVGLAHCFQSTCSGTFSRRRQSFALAAAPRSAEEVSRRAALDSLFVAAMTAGATKAQAADLVAAAKRRENDNKYEINSNGAPEKHIPQVKITKGNNLEVYANHVMDPEKPHFIELIWLKDMKNSEIVVAKAFPADSPSPPTLQVRVPSGVKLKPMLFCNIHGLWEGEAFSV